MLVALFRSAFPPFFSFVFLKGLLNLKKYDHRLYADVEDLAVWAGKFSYSKG